MEFDWYFPILVVYLVLFTILAFSAKREGLSDSVAFAFAALWPVIVPVVYLDDLRIWIGKKICRRAPSP